MISSEYSPLVQGIMDDYDRVMSQSDADIDALDENGHSLLSRILMNFGALPAGWPKATSEDLIKMGARLIGGDCPFKKMLQMESADVRNWLVDTALDNLLESGRENPIFLVAAHAPGYFRSTSMTRAFWGNNEKLKSIMNRWINERNEEGKTPSHYLWDADTLLTAQYHNAERAPHRLKKAFVEVWNTTLHVCFDAQQMMMDRGVKLDAIDNQGHSILDAIIERIEQGEAQIGQNHLDLYPVARLVNTEIERLALESNTPVAQASSRGMRL